MIRYDEFIDHHQKAHRDFEVNFPKMIIKLKKKRKKQEIKIIQLKTINFNRHISHKYLIIIKFYINTLLIPFTFKLS